MEWFERQWAGLKGVGAILADMLAVCARHPEYSIPILCILVLGFFASFPTSVKVDNSAVSAADRGFYRFEKSFNLMAGIVALLVMLLAVANILGRKIAEYALDFGFEGVTRWFGPVPGYVDWTEQAVPAIAILGLAFCQRNGGHIRMDLVVGNLKGRAVWLAELLGVILMLVITIGLIYGTWDHASRAYRNGDSSVDIGLQTWPAKVLFPIMFTLLAVRLLLQIWAYARALRRGDDFPVAVPLVEDAATQAKNEAQSVSGFDDEISETRG